MPGGGVLGLQRDRGVPPEIFRRTRFYRIFWVETRFYQNQKGGFTGQNDPISTYKPVFTVPMPNFIPVFRDFFAEKPARTGGTSLSVHIGEYPPRGPNTMVSRCRSLVDGIYRVFFLLLDNFKTL